MSTEGQRASKIQEKRITKTLKQLGEEARRQMASGSMWFAKSDVVSTNFRIEAKTKIKPSSQMIIKKEWIDKIREEALETGRIPVLAFSFGTNTDYFILEARDFYELAEILKQYKEMKNDA